MIKQAIEKIQDMALAAKDIQTVSLKCGRVIHVLQNHQNIEDKAPRPEELELHTLQSTADFIRETQKTEWPADLVVVDNEGSISVYGKMQPIYSDRPLLAHVTPLAFGMFRFNDFRSVESFIIGLQSCFVPNANRNTVIDAIAGIQSQEGMTYKDDGVSQTVTAKKGVSLAQTRQIPNPVALTPYRTFSEVEQPESQFVLRVSESHGEPSVGLWEADGGAWKVEASTSIKQWLESELSDCNVRVLG